MPLTQRKEIAFQRRQGEQIAHGVWPDTNLTALRALAESEDEGLG